MGDHHRVAIVITHAGEEFAMGRPVPGDGAAALPPDPTTGFQGRPAIPPTTKIVAMYPVPESELGDTIYVFALPLNGTPMYGNGLVFKIGPTAWKTMTRMPPLAAWKAEMDEISARLDEMDDEEQEPEAAAGPFAPNAMPPAPAPVAVAPMIPPPHPAPMAAPPSYLPTMDPPNGISQV